MLSPHLARLTRLHSHLSRFSTMAATPNIMLYTAATPNGRKVSVFLEELKSAYNLSYEYKTLSLSQNDQKADWYLKINPNGRIPAIVDKNRNDFAVFETGSILLYLAQHYDTEKKFSFSLESDEYSEVLQWMFFANAGVGPMQGQANHFNRAAPEKILYAIKRYQDETKRLYSVLEGRLASREYLVGAGKGKYSIADINAVTWVRGYKFSGIENIDEFPHLEAWIKRIEGRPEVASGLQIPSSI